VSYLDFLSNLPHLSWEGLTPLFFLIMCRIAPIIAIVPFLGSKVTPIPAKMGLVICLSLIFFPMIAATTSPSFGFNTAFLGYGIKELFIGFVLGFMASVPFYIVQTSGIIIDYLRGASIMQMQDPTFQNQASPIGVFYNYILIVIFFQVNGLFLFLSALAQSYQIIPADGLLNPLFFQSGFPFWQTVLDLLNQVATIAIQLASPALVAILMAEMFLGIANRLAPQVQIAFLGMSVKSFLGLAVIWVGWFFLLKQFSAQLLNWLNAINGLVRNLQLISVGT
jgi:type III secretion protein T